MYQPELGRFTARDPMPENGQIIFAKLPDGILTRPPHPYDYADNNPVNMVDPSGMAPLRNCNRSMGYNIACGCFPFCNWFTVESNSRRAMETALSEADKLFKDRGDVSHRAMRHCITLGIIAMENSCRCARCVGLVRETYQTECENQAQRERDRGEFNNQQGRDCVGCTGPEFMWGPAKQLTVRKLVACCKKKLDNDDLDTGAGPRLGAGD